MIPNFQISNYHLDRDIEHNISGYIYIYIDQFVGLGFRYISESWIFFYFESLPLT